MSTIVTGVEIPEAAPELDLEQIAAAIRREHEAAGIKVRESLEHARACGELLMLAKAEVGHGQFMKWVAVNCPFSQDTADLYMRVARNWSRLLNSERVQNMSLRDAGRFISSLDAEPTEGEGHTPVEILERLGFEQGDLNGLSKKQRNVVVEEIRQLWNDFSDEVHPTSSRTEKAKGLAILMDWRFIRRLVVDMLRELKEGRIGHARVRERLRPWGDQEELGDGDLRETVKFRLKEGDPAGQSVTLCEPPRSVFKCLGIVDPRPSPQPSAS